MNAALDTLATPAEEVGVWGGNREAAIEAYEEMARARRR